MIFDFFFGPFHFFFVFFLYMCFVLGCHFILYFFFLCFFLCFYVFFLCFCVIFSQIILHRFMALVGNGVGYGLGGLYRKLREGCLGVVVNFCVVASLRVGLVCFLSLSVNEGIILL